MKDELSQQISLASWLLLALTQGVAGGGRTPTFGSMIGQDQGIGAQCILSFQEIHERAFSLALQSWLAKVSPSQPGLALVELNKPG